MRNFGKMSCMRIASLLSNKRSSHCLDFRRSYSIPIKMSFSLFESPKTDQTKTPVIIMHGLFGSKQNWRGISKALEAKLKRRIYAVDARNHGDSPHSSEHSSSSMAADVAEFMKDKGISQACVLGHSMGGRTMMYLALKYPELVERGIIVDISPLDLPRDFSYMEGILTAMQNTKIPSEVSMPQGRKQAENQIKDAVGNQATVDFILMNLRKGKNGFYWAANVDSLLKNIGEFSTFSSQISSISPFQNPMTFICGNASNYVNPGSWPEIQKIFPNSEIHWLDAGHLVHLEQPAKFVDIVVEFIKRETH